MPTLAKLLDCLKWPKAAGGGTPVRPRGEVSPVSDPELTFGWQGYLFNNAVLSNQAANAVITSVTIPDDCFYIIDATANYSAAGGGAGTVVIVRLALQILDPAGPVAYSLAFGFATAIVTLTSVTNTPPAEIYNLRMHLPAGAIVRWIQLDAGITADRASASLSLRKLFEENL